MAHKTLKDRLIERLKIAKDRVGPSWRKKLAENDEFFNSLEGATFMESAAGVMTGRYISIERLIRVTKALEKIAGIEHEPIV